MRNEQPRVLSRDVESLHDEACYEVGLEKFFPENPDGTSNEGTTKNPSPAARRAIQMCAECLVAQECLTGALQRKEVAGIWGGHNTLQRKAILAELGKRGKTLD